MNEPLASDDSLNAVDRSDSAAVNSKAHGYSSPAPGGLSEVLRAGTAGEAVSAQGLLSVVGGIRGIFEAVVPSVAFLVIFVLTQDARISVIAPITVAAIAVIARLIARQPLTAALSGLFGVLVCAGATLLSGRGETYFVPGFFINAAWILALVTSLIVRWPLIGLLLGYLRGSVTQWRTVPLLKQAATLCTWLWLTLFAARMAVQLPLFFAAENGSPGALEALGLARIVMGTPLFALAALFTWLILTRVSTKTDINNVVNTND